MKFIETTNRENSEVIQLCYEDYGKGKPVVLLHGWPLCKEMWEYQLDVLVSAGLRVITYDRRGFGNSSKPWNGYDYDTLADDLNTVLDKLDLQDVTLVCFSMGGGEMARYCSRHGGKRVNSIILVSSILPYLLQTEDNPDGVTEEHLNSMLKQVQEDRINFLDEFGRHFFGADFFNHPLRHPLMEYYRMLGSLASPRATKECMKAFVYTDFREDMKAINMPVLIIHGDADKTVPINASSRKAAELIADTQFVLYEGAPHGLFYTEKNRLCQDIISFVTTGKAATNNISDKVYSILPSNEGLITRD